jgi:CRP-like cAMP-binding protein
MSIMMEQGLYGIMPEDSLPCYILVHEAPINLGRTAVVAFGALLQVCFWPVVVAWNLEQDPASANYERVLLIVILSRVVFALDLALSFVTTTLNASGTLLTKPRDIAWQNMRSGKTFLDVLALLTPSEFLMVKVLRLPDLAETMANCAHASHFGCADISDENVSFMFQFSRLSMIFFACLHIFACGWHHIFLSGYLLDNPDAFTDDVILTDSRELFDEYSISLQETVAMLLGAGSFTFPTKPYARLYSSMVCTFGAILQAWVFGQVAAVLARVGEKESRYKQKMLSMSARMKQLQLPQELRTRVKSFYEMMWITTGSLTLDADDFVGGLSPPIQQDVMLNLFGDMVTKIPFMHKVSKSTVHALVMQMRPEAYLTGDLVIQKGAPGNWMGFVSEGELAIIDPNKKLPEWMAQMHFASRRLPDTYVIGNLIRGDFFGEIGLLYDVPRTCAIVAHTFCQLQVLSRADFKKIEELHPEDWAIILEEFDLYREKKKYRSSISTQQKVPLTNTTTRTRYDFSHFISFLPRTAYQKVDQVQYLTAKEIKARTLVYDNKREGGTSQIPDPPTRDMFNSDKDFRDALKEYREALKEHKEQSWHRSLASITAGSR